MYSGEIERFMRAIKQCQLDYDYHFQNVHIKDKETQDFLHELEFCEYKNKGKAATKLSKVRKERRVSKDIVENTEPIVKYINDHKKLVNELSQLLGQVRKAEKSHYGRVYVARIREDLTI